MPSATLFGRSDNNSIISLCFWLHYLGCTLKPLCCRVADKDWGADFRKLSGGAALVALTLWLDHMQVSCTFFFKKNLFFI